MKLIVGKTAICGDCDPPVEKNGLIFELGGKLPILNNYGTCFPPLFLNNLFNYINDIVVPEV